MIDGPGIDYPLGGVVEVRASGFGQCIQNLRGCREPADRVA